MKAKQTLTRLHRVITLILLLVFMTLCAAYLIYSNQSSTILPDQAVKTHYKQIQCQIVSKKLAIKHRVLRSYRADFLVSYADDNVQYRRWVAGNGLDMSYFRDASEQEDILTRYHVGGDYPCFINPKDPRMVVLVLRHEWGSIVPFVAATMSILLAFCLGLYQVFRLVVKLPSRNIQKPRAPRKVNKSKK